MIIFYFHHFFNIYYLDFYYNSEFFLTQTNYMYNCINYLFIMWSYGYWFYSMGFNILLSLLILLLKLSYISSSHWFLCSFNIPPSFFEHLSFGILRCSFQPWNQPFLYRARVCICFYFLKYYIYRTKSEHWVYLG